MYQVIEADSLADMADRLNELRTFGSVQVDIILVDGSTTRRALVKTRRLPDAPYVIAEAKSGGLLMAQVNALYREGYRPVGGIITAGMFFYQAMSIP